MKKPWQVPGYTFSIGWPVGYEPTAAAQVVADKRAAAAKAIGAKATAKRAASGDAYTPGFGSKTGTMHGMQVKRDPTKGARIRKAAKL